MKKKILIIITILFLTTTLGVFAVSNFAYSENTEKTKATCNPDTCPPNGKKGVKAEYIRMQIPIPGVTHTCTYHPDPKASELKPCHYIEANLPLYIKKIYNFAIGVIAIIAVVMIMIGGLQWIFAAGNPGTISQAKSNITAAVSGLILALASYVILNTINPSLVELKMQMPEEIGKIVAGESNWCDRLPEKIEGKDRLISKVENTDKESDLIGASDTKCGKKYYYGYYDPNKKRFVSVGRCDGRGDCGEGVCIAVGGATHCVNPKALCENYDKRNCREVDKILQDTQSGYGCAPNKREFLGSDWLAADKCVYGAVLLCNPPGEPGAKQISCFDKNAEGNCWVEENGRTKIVEYDYGSSNLKIKTCLDLNERTRPVMGSSYLCCDLGSLGIKAVGGGEGSGFNFNCVTANWLNQKKVCEVYHNEYECVRDRCKFSKTGCQWTGTMCVKK